MLFYSSSILAYQLHVVTENFPSYQAINKDGKLEGPAAEKVRNILAHSNIAYQINIESWATAYSAVKRDSNTCIFSIGRNRARENQFNWLFPIAKFTSSFYALKDSNIVMNDLEDAFKYRTAVIRNNFSHQYLKEHGFSEEKNLVIVSTFNKVLELLETRRSVLDLVVLSDTQVNSVDNKETMMRFLKPVFALANLDQQLYFACNLDVPKNVTDKIIKSYQSLYLQN